MVASSEKVGRAGGRGSSTEATISYNLILETISHHFCCILFPGSGSENGRKGDVAFYVQDHPLKEVLPSVEVPFGNRGTKEYPFAHLFRDILCAGHCSRSWEIHQ